jgi:arabinogalactan endo-1,4-beta-galactosidase
MLLMPVQVLRFSLWILRFASVARRLSLLWLLLSDSAFCGPVPFLVGADVSALSTLESHGAVYRREGRKEDALKILRDEGMNCFRLRLFVAPDGKDVVTNDLDYTLALARRVKESGASLLLDIHYSDTWADPQKQYKPAAWRDLSFEDLRTTLRAYTADVLKRFVREGLKPDFVQLGNEITNGLLWPEGRVDFARRQDRAAWERLGALLCAAHQGLADAFPGQDRPISILHIESPNQLERAQWFCREAGAARVPFDWIGVSYYPDWHGAITDLERALNILAVEFQKPVLVVETAYPWIPDEHWKTRSNMAWPLTQEGQTRFLRDVLAVVRAVPKGLGRGLVYWYPEALQVPDIPVWVGASCSLFDRRGNVLPAAGFAHSSTP